MARRSPSTIPPPKVDPTPGDVGRFALHMDAFIFATQLMGWCDDDEMTERITIWFEAVYLALRERPR